VKQPWLGLEKGPVKT